MQFGARVWAGEERVLPSRRVAAVVQKGISCWVRECLLGRRRRGLVFRNSGKLKDYAVMSDSEKGEMGGQARV